MNEMKVIEFRMIYIFLKINKILNDFFANNVEVKRLLTSIILGWLNL
jgi:hypothetical protein